MAIGSEDIEAYERRRLAAVSGRARPRLARVLAQMPYPELAAAVSDIVADSRGYLWVRRYAKPRADAAEWHVFTPTGRRVALLRLPSELDILDIRGDRLLALTRDELDREIVEIYRVLRPPSPNP